MIRKFFVAMFPILLLASCTTICIASGVDDDQTKKARSQQSVTKHTKDPLETVLNRVNRKDAILIDVRELAEWDAGHLRNAVLLPLSELKQASSNAAVQKKLAKLSKEKIVYCHCRSGGRVLMAAPILKSLGYDVRPLKAGYASLLQAGFEKAPPKKKSPTE